MTQGIERAKAYINAMVDAHGLDVLCERLRPKDAPLPAPVSGRNDASREAVERRWKALEGARDGREEILDPHTVRQLERYERNVEHLLGTVKVPVGLVGPLRVNGLFANGDYYVPLATSEASLVASYSRGAALISEAGGASVALLSEGVSRAPVFGFRSLEELCVFLHWAVNQYDEIVCAANSTTRFGRLDEIDVSVEGTKVYFSFIFFTGDAAGQNMVSIATHAAVKWILAHTPVTPSASYIEGNFSGDKKASAQSFQRVRGRKVVAVATLPAGMVERHLHTTPKRVAELAHIGQLGCIMSGTIGASAHCANGLTALFLACGQDVACVAEAAIGVTDFELDEDGSLRASVTLPNLIVGTVGGGTGLPSQRANLEILGLAGTGNARAFAEVAAALCLAGEISLTGAVSAGHFAAAHALLARGRHLDPA